MSNDQRFMSIRGYGKLRGVAESTLRFHIRSGTIVLDKHGRVDREQADLAWARRRRQSSTPGGQAAAAKIRRARAQLALAQDEVAQLDDEYADAAEARVQYQAEAAYVIATLQAMPAIEAASVGEQLGISSERAERLLNEFVALCVQDIAGLSDRLARAIDLA